MHFVLFFRLKITLWKFGWTTSSLYAEHFPVISYIHEKNYPKIMNTVKWGKRGWRGVWARANAGVCVCICIYNNINVNINTENVQLVLCICSEMCHKSLPPGPRPCEDIVQLVNNWLRSSTVNRTIPHLWRFGQEVTWWEQIATNLSCLRNNLIFLHKLMLNAESSCKPTIFRWCFGW